MFVRTSRDRFNLLAIAAVTFAIGCSGPSDPNQKIVLAYLKKEHGRDPVTVVKAYGTARSDDKLTAHLDELSEIGEMTRKLAQESYNRWQGELDEMKGQVDEGSLKIRRLTLESRGEAQKLLLRTERDLASLKDLKAYLPFTATKLIYRVPDERGENSLNSKLFILRDGQVDQVVDLKTGHPYAGFAERAFRD